MTPARPSDRPSGRHAERGVRHATRHGRVAYAGALLCTLLLAALAGCRIDTASAGNGTRDGSGTGLAPVAREGSAERTAADDPADRRAPGRPAASPGDVRPVGGALTAGLQASPSDPQQSLEDSRSTAIVRATARVAPAVVSVNVLRTERVRARSIWENLYLPPGAQRRSAGFGSGSSCARTGSS